MVAVTTRKRWGSMVAMLGLLGATLAMIVGTAAPAAAAPFTVNTMADTVDAAPGDGVCADGGGNCSLRAAIQETNALAGADTITVPAGTYNLTLIGTGEDLAATGDLDIRGSVTIRGAGAATTTVNAIALVNDRVFHVIGSFTEFNYTLRDLTITGGSVASSGGGVLHAGWIDASTLRLVDVVISNNSATGGGANGGGVFNDDNLVLNRATVTNNLAGNDGGGLYTNGSPASTTVSGGAFTLNRAFNHGGGVFHGDGAAGAALDFTMTNTTINGNAADSDTAGGGNGGGIYLTNANTNAAITGATIRNTNTATNGGGVYLDGVTAAITDGTVGPNTAALDGGGIYVAGGTVTVTDSAVRGNTADDDGGGIYATGGPLTITGSTVAGNTANDNGGGILTLTDLTMTTSTVSGNTAAGGPSNFGGGVAMTGIATLINVTVSGNTGDLLGGGIYLASGGLTVTNATITANTSASGAGLYRTAGTATLGGTIVAGNTDSAPGTPDPDCSSLAGGIVTSGYNLIGSNASCNYPAAGPGDQVGTGAPAIDPVLGPLGSNAATGPFTHAVLAGSPALNAIPPGACTTLLGPGSTDERGITRPQGTNCDVGAYEGTPATAVNDSYATTVDTVLTVPGPGVLGNDTDVEGDTLRVRGPASITAANGTMAMAANGSFTYTPNSGFVGNDSFTYAARDATGISNVATATIAVTAPPPPPPPPPGGRDVGLVDPTQGQWHLRNSAGTVTTFFYGNPGDFPLMGDWDCDGTDTPGMYRQSDGFVYVRNSNSVGIADRQFFLGNPGDVPLAGDFNNDGCDTVSIYRPSEQRFYIANTLAANNAGISADFSFLFGNPGDKPVTGDWDNDGITEIGLHRETTGFFYWRNTLDTGIASDEIFFGDPGDRFVAGDWGIVDGVDTPAVFRPTGTTFFFRHTLTQGVADSQFVFGESSWLPVAGAFGLG